MMRGPSSRQKVSVRREIAVSVSNETLFDPRIEQSLTTGQERRRQGADSRELGAVDDGADMRLDGVEVVAPVPRDGVASRHRRRSHGGEASMERRNGTHDGAEAVVRVAVDEERGEAASGGQSPHDDDAIDDGARLDHI